LISHLWQMMSVLPTFRRHMISPSFTRGPTKRNLYIHRNSPTLYTSTLKMEAACTSETTTTLRKLTRCKQPVAEVHLH
jgi:hypothetical protein